MCVFVTQEVNIWAAGIQHCLKEWISQVMQDAFGFGVVSKCIWGLNTESHFWPFINRSPCCKNILGFEVFRSFWNGSAAKAGEFSRAAGFLGSSLMWMKRKKCRKLLFDGDFQVFLKLDLYPINHFGAREQGPVCPVSEHTLNNWSQEHRLVSSWSAACYILLYKHWL